jgi:hypothetical protein
MKLELWLPGHLTPSLNQTQGWHWKKALNEKRKARRALLSALQGAQFGSSTVTTYGEAQRRSLILYAIQNLSLAMLIRKSSSSSNRNKSGLKKRLVP